MILEGRVISKRINVGSKSEHLATMLVTAEGEFKLRRQGGHPFTDPEITSLVGKRIRGEGLVSSRQFIMERYDVLEA
jgi:hypothetical protein